jgi:hypothetical protein
MEMQFWNAARQAVLKSMALGDPIGLLRAIERRGIVLWLREASANVDPAAVGLPWQAVEAVKVDFRMINEGDVGAIEFYEQADAWIANGTLRLH